MSSSSLEATLPSKLVTETSRPETRMLEIRRQAFEAQRALVQGKEDTIAHESKMHVAEEELHKRDLELQETMLRMTTIIQENDAKRARAEKRLQEEKKLIITKSKEITDNQQQVHDLYTEIHVLEHRKDKLSKYYEYLANYQALHPQEFNDIATIVARHHTLRTAQNDLLAEQGKLLNELEISRKNLSKIIKSKSTQALENDNILGKMRERLDNARALTIRLTQGADEAILTRSNKTYELCLALQSIHNLYNRCSKGTFGSGINHTAGDAEVLGIGVADFGKEVLKEVDSQLLAKYLLEHKEEVENDPNFAFLKLSNDEDEKGHEGEDNTDNFLDDNNDGIDGEENRDDNNNNTNTTPQKQRTPHKLSDSSSKRVNTPPVFIAGLAGSPRRNKDEEPLIPQNTSPNSLLQEITGMAPRTIQKKMMNAISQTIIAGNYILDFESIVKEHDSWLAEQKAIAESKANALAAEIAAKAEQQRIAKQNNTRTPTKSVTKSAAALGNSTGTTGESSGNLQRSSSHLSTNNSNLFSPITTNLRPSSLATGPPSSTSGGGLNGSSSNMIHSSTLTPNKYLNLNHSTSSNNSPGNKIASVLSKQGIRTYMIPDTVKLPMNMAIPIPSVSDLKYTIVPNNNNSSSAIYNSTNIRNSAHLNVSNSGH